MKKSLYILLSVVVLMVCVSFTKPAERYFEIAKNLDIFATLFKEVNALYVDEVNPNQLIRTGIDAMLASPLPALQGRERDFVDLLLSDSEDVRFEARNFIRKYPVDAFDDIFKSLKGMNDPSLSFAATYFYYSRILSLSASDHAVSDDVLAEHGKGTDWAGNLTGPLEADAAVLDYGLSYAYFSAALEDESYLGKAQDSASAFLVTVRDSDGRYLFPRHVAQALAIESGDLETAAEIAASTAELPSEPLFFDATAGAPSYPIGDSALRRAPLATAEDVGAVEIDQKVELLGSVDGWDLVKSRGGVGWLAR